MPVLRKDFILDELQILEARAAGAAAVLLIVRALPQPRLAALLAAARAAGLDALVEVHTPGEVATRARRRRATSSASTAGTSTLSASTPTAAWRLLRSGPPDRVAVAESGMASAADVETAAAAGADAVLIGTALSSAATPEALLAALTRVPRRAR